MYCLHWLRAYDTLVRKSAYLCILQLVLFPLHCDTQLTSFSLLLLSYTKIHDIGHFKNGNNYSLQNLLWFGFKRHEFACLWPRKALRSHLKMTFYSLIFKAVSFLHLHMYLPGFLNIALWSLCIFYIAIEGQLYLSMTLMRVISLKTKD